MTHHTPEHVAARARMHPTRHGLDEQARRSIVIMLNQRLADSADLYSQTKHAHWNVKGMDFYQLHKLFDELAEIVEKHIDELAERATALGGTALGTVRMAAQNSALPDMPTDALTGREFVEALVERYARHAKGVGEGIDRAEESGDKVTADLLTEIAAEIDKALYFLESHLQGRATP
ncbi:MAG TPA: DNA starvation/stationary phase protection protein Dps [Candidatus Thermoplasmatota archaeon]|nr:DNA starvation/stationary phase protection protein Dps [Candidatus Thermoplasmatota archaeon]